MEAGTSRPNQNVAIVGIGCRYGNGVNSVKQFWEMLVEGLDCTTPIPPDRFDASYFLSPGEKTAGKMYIQNGGYISQDPYMFDRQFFKMPPDEAAHLDPQVRLLLEVTWEALENAGIPPSAIRGSKTGVYMGVTAQDYASFVCKPFHNMNQYSNSGSNSCMVSNRISYEFDLRGPSFSVNTACSSSLYSIYLACEALKQKSCSMAVAGGVNLILSPACSIGFCQAGMLSGDGKCKSFDQAADGYSRSEGAGVLVLKPLEDALRSGDRIYAVLRGGALTNDGRTPGIANPSYAAQVNLVKSACHNAGVHPHQIVYAEAHGTGTRVGDTTEAGALGEVMGRQRTHQHPLLYIGSVKSNLGHSVGAAGVAGIIKVALCLHQRKIPAVVHFKTPNENVDFTALQIHVPTKLTPWPVNCRYLSCCNSFGFGGANANVVLEGPAYPKSNGNFTTKEDILSCLLLSAANPNALHQRINDWVDFLTADQTMTDHTFYSCLYTAASRSQHHPYRVGFAVHSRKDALHQLRMKLDDEPEASARFVEGLALSTSGSAQQIVFVFSGMGTQWWGMARELMHTQPIFASKMKVIDTMLQNCGAKWSLVNMLSDEKDHGRINKTEVSQPCLCAIAIGLVDLWKMRGVVPDAVVGHSVGEVAAAYAAGLLSLEHTVKLIYRRGRELRKTSGSGKMVAVLHRVEEAIQLTRKSKHGKLLDVAAINSPGQIVFSGESSAVEGLVNELKTDEIKCVVLKVNNAFHSKQQEVVKNPFLKKVGKFLKIQNPAGRSNTIPMMSTVTGRYLTVGEANSPGYWFQNIRQKVSFMDALRNLAKDGYRVFVEIGPHPSLLPALQDTFSDFQGAEDKFITTASLLRPQDTNMTARDSENLLLSQMRLHVNGVPMGFDSLFNSPFRRVVSIPHYPWQREKCSNVTQEARKEFLFPVRKGQHLLLGEPIETFYLRESPVKIWRADLNASSVPWVKDYVLQAAVVVPAAAYTDTALAAARLLNDDNYPLILSGLTINRFMFAPDAEGCLESTVEEKTPGQILFTLRSHEESRGKWTQHCHVNIIPPSMADLTELMPSDKQIDVERIKQRCEYTMTSEDFYSQASDCGFQLGPTFRGVQTLSTSEDCRESLLYAEAPLSVKREFHCYVYHPAFMDSVMQAFAVLLLGAARRADQLSGKLLQPVYRVPKSMKRFSLFGPTPSRVFIHVKMSASNNSYCDIDVADAETKNVFCSVRELLFETIQTDKVEPQVWSTSWDNLGSLDITEQSMNSSASVKKVVFFPDETEVSTSLAAFLIKEDDTNVTVVDVKEADAVQKAMKILSDNQESETLLIMMKTEVAGICLNSGSVMSSNEFEECQDKGPLFCFSVCKALQSAGLKPKLLLLTRGAYHSKDGDDVNPFAASLATFGVTVSQEEPSIRYLNVDLPIAANNFECVQIARKIIRNEDYFLHDENVVAVRKPTPNEKDQQGAAWEFLSPRLKMTIISKAPGVVPTSDWSVGGQGVSDQSRIVIKKSRPEKINDSIDENIRVKVEAFSVNKKQMLDGENVSVPIICVYAGRAEEQSGLKVMSGKLGLSECTEVLPYMASSSNDLIDVPGFLTCVEAVSIVTDYFPSALFFNQALPISSGMRLVFKLDSLDSVNLTTVHLATKLGADAIILTDDHNDQDMIYSEIGVSCSSEVAEASIDVLFLSTKSSTLDRTLQSLLPKLRRSGTIVIMQRQHQETRLQRLPSKIKTVIFDANLTLAVDGLTSAEISNTISDLLQMFNPNVADSHPRCHLEDNQVLSSVAALNADIPEGKVIEVDGVELLLPPSLEEDGFVADEKSAYFITGGTRGFGLKLLEWLVSRGARYIYTGSRGEINDEVRNAIQQAAKVGAHVQHIQMDVSNASDVELGLKRMNGRHQQWPSLKCIFHCAAVFSDAFLQNITTESWNSVMAPKAYGALLLHQLTLKLGIQLDHFIMMSSIVSLIGNAGQGSYCAANVFLNSLAQCRHNLGLPATALQVGVISDVGFAERQGLVQTFEKKGFGSMRPVEVLGFIGCAFSIHQPLLGISGSFNRKIYAARHRDLMIEHFREEHGTMSMMKDIFKDREVYLTSTNDTLLQSILKLPSAKAREVVTKTLTKLLSQQLGLSDEVPHDASPISLGLDSLMASEVSQVITQQFEVTVGALDLLNDKNTIQELAKTITRDMMAKADSTLTQSLVSGDSTASSKTKVVIEGEAPKSVGVKLVCFPSNGAGPSLFASYIKPLLQHDVQLLMIQLPGWEGREDEKPLTNIRDIASIIRDELAAYLLGSPFIFLGHSMGSLVAFEVAHLLLAEDNMCPRHLFVSAWYPPTTAYPHPEELEVNTANFERLKKILEIQPRLFANLAKENKFSFSFVDNSTLSNTALMRRLIPCIEAAIEIVRGYTCKHRKPLPCDVTAFGGKQDEFIPPDLLNGWELQRSKEHTFKKITFPGKHMFILTNTAEIMKWVCIACNNVAAR